MGFTFSKIEKLKWERSIQAVFSSRNRITKFPIKIQWAFIEEDFPVKVLISCPKKNIKSAVKRNRTKRILREAYRLNKKQLLEHCLQKNVKIGLAVVYLGNEIPKFEYINEKVLEVIPLLINQLDTTLDEHE